MLGHTPKLLEGHRESLQTLNKPGGPGQISSRAHSTPSVDFVADGL